MRANAFVINYRVESRPQDVIVFIIGGATYEEARAVALLNQHPTAGGTAAALLVLGATCTHNPARCASPIIHREFPTSTLFPVSSLDMIESAAANFPAVVYEPPPESASN